MHKSRLGSLVIDCENTTDLDAGAAFWAQALGWPARRLSSPEGANYRRLQGPAKGPTALVQSVSHPSRVHLDIETDDVEAEAARLERLGARRIQFVKHWWVMEAPTGHRFCVVPPQRPDFATGANTWDDAHRTIGHGDPPGEGV